MPGSQVLCYVKYLYGTVVLKYVSANASDTRVIVFRLLREQLFRGNYGGFESFITVQTLPNKVPSIRRPRIKRYTRALRVENKKKWVLHMKQYYTHFHFRTLLKYYNRRTTQVEAFLIWEQYKTRKYSKCRTIKITLTEKEIHGSGDLFLQICESRVSQFLKRTFTSWSSMSPWYARFTGSLLC